MRAGHSPLNRAPAVRECDILVIGSGAGGSSVALDLAAAGRRVTVIEEGPRVTTADLAAATPAENMRRLYRQGGLTPIFGRPTIAYGEGRCVGGTTVVNGGLLWDPPAALLNRWAAVSGTDGYRATDLAPHLRRITERLGAGPQQPGGGNRDSVLLSAGADRLGWRWQSANRAVHGCLRRNRCTTGCTSGAKQSMALTYLPRAEELGAEIVPDTRALRIRHDGRNVHGVLCVDGRGRRTLHRARAVFVAAGPIGTPALLQRSGILPAVAGRELALHVNLRTVARFAEPVDAANGTIFTAQVQEFSDRGTLVMPSNLTPGSLAAALAGHGPDLVERILGQIDRSAVYTTQLRLRGSARVSSTPLGGVLLTHAMTPEDHRALRTAFHDTARLLLAAGAVELVAPVASARPLRTMAEVEDLCSRVRPGDWQLVSVHGMASCRMGRADRGGVCDDLGRPHGYRNLYVSDAAVLPGVTGISPQGTIMAFAHEIAARFANT
ncbi:GMC family oxidoreductase [Streptomyces sp. BE20]|uniref:GMC family oxidoreductase n=1 Tax=unclassified Streptomyces TaxID=2593676 RepID=UPI002E790EA6|nr:MULTISPECIES: GMC family oxidoreductase [unclassified Streptomyces]MED7950204.1 GMC family oxidoreductase [Streptomyces sp. BE303]MEE1822169.1 GMC family oxidoreductase [Streptomyces sp. BE20]